MRAAKTLSLLELMARFPDEASAEKWLVEQRWPDGIVCPKCGCDRIHHRRNRKPSPYRCRDCRRYFSVKTDSLMHSSPLTCQKWVIAMFLFQMNPKGISSVRLAQYLGVTQKCGWHLLHRLRENFADKHPLLQGTVESDECYLGGKFKSMHAKKKKEMRKLPNYGKMVVVGAISREQKKCVAKFIHDADGPTLLQFIEENVDIAESRLYTDAAGPYEDYPRHESVCHSKGEYVRGDVTTNGIESIWATIKRQWHGTNHFWTPKHCQRYLDEVTGRLNLRGLDTLTAMGEIVRGMDMKRLPYRELTA